MYSYLTIAFERGVKCVDELSQIRGDDSLRSNAVRALAGGPHNHGGTGTHLSNYINDACCGICFTLGNAARFADRVLAAVATSAEDGTYSKQ